MTRPLVEELQRLGVPLERAESIADDIAVFDARSLLSELLLGGLWKLVLDETQPTQLAAAGGSAVGRLLAKGVDPADVLDVVRETQVDIIYNVAQLLDWPTMDTRLEVMPELVISVAIEREGASALPIHPLHERLLERDPSGRHGEPRAPVVRMFQELPEDDRTRIIHLLQERKFSAAAVQWKRCVGGELAECLDAVQELRRQLRHALTN